MPFTVRAFLLGLAPLLVLLLTAAVPIPSRVSVTRDSTTSAHAETSRAVTASLQWEFHAPPSATSTVLSTEFAGVIGYPVDEAPSGISLDTTLLLMTEVAGLFASDVAATGADFAWEFDWTKPWLGAGSKMIFDTRSVASTAPTASTAASNSSSASSAKHFSIMLWGGYVRADTMTLPALELTLCHEFGHLLGGSPHQEFPDEVEHWSSAEGQADWWAASACLPRLYAARGLSAPEIQIRIRSASGDFGKFVQRHFDTNSPAVSVDLRAAEEPATTLTLAYPSTQCRVDTILQGAACASAISDAATLTGVSSVRPFFARQVFELREDLKACVRPRCWYVPEN